MQVNHFSQYLVKDDFDVLHCHDIDRVVSTRVVIQMQLGWWIVARLKAFDEAFKVDIYVVCQQLHGIVELVANSLRDTDEI